MARAKWQSCNVLRTGAPESVIWHFQLRKKRFVPAGEVAVAAEKPVPVRLAGRDWKTLLQPRLDIAWLPPEHVFLQVVQLPQSSFEETISMVDLQLERLSPMPVAQVVWTICPLPSNEEGMQTVVVVMAERDAVEGFLGSLEEKGYLADRLDLSILDQLQALDAQQDGAWILPQVLGNPDRALVAWYYGGNLRSLGYVQVPDSSDPGEAVRDQLLQMAWAGELDGWLTKPPAWQLVAEGAIFERWQPMVSEGLGDTVAVVEPKPAAVLAESTAARALSVPGRGLLPVDYSTRYRQQFTDRLWMRGLGGVLVLYLIGVAIYFSILGFEKWRLNSVRSEVTSLGNSYTNAMRLRERFTVLKDRQDLKFAALDCWQVAAEFLPSGANLEQLKFSDGKTLTLFGTAPTGSASELIDFSEAIRKKEVRGQPLFKPVGGRDLKYSQNRDGRTVNWNLTLELQRTEAR